MDRLQACNQSGHRGLTVETSAEATQSLEFNLGGVAVGGLRKYARGQVFHSSRSHLLAERSTPAGVRQSTSRWGMMRALQDHGLCEK